MREHKLSIDHQKVFYPPHLALDLHAFTQILFLMLVPGSLFALSPVSTTDHSFYAEGLVQKKKKKRVLRLINATQTHSSSFGM